MKEDIFQLKRSNSISEQVSSHIKQLVAKGHLKPGDKLPSERELSRLTGKGRLSIREGLRILETQGIVRTTSGVNKGTYVRKIEPEDLVGGFSDLLRFSEIPLSVLSSARLEISLITLRLVIENLNEELFMELEKCIEKAEKNLAAGIYTREDHLNFHGLIAEGSGNVVLASIHKAVLSNIRYLLKDFAITADHEKQIIENNRQILRHTKKRDYAKASLAMVKQLSYLDRWHHSFLERLK